MPQSSLRFASKVDSWYFVLMAVVFASSAIVATPRAQAGKWWGFALLVLPFALVTWNLLSTYYVIDNDTLLVRCMIFRKSVPLSAVTKVRASRDFRSAPALSLDRLEVLAGTDSIFVSPRDRQEFIEALLARQPALVVEL
jgi:hypothetical protein